MANPTSPFPKETEPNGTFFARRIPGPVARSCLQLLAMGNNSSNDLLTLGQAKAATGLPIKRLRNAVRRGEIPEYRFGAWRRVRRLDLEAWIEEHRTGAQNGESARER